MKDNEDITIQNIMCSECAYKKCDCPGGFGDIGLCWHFRRRKGRLIHDANIVKETGLICHSCKYTPDDCPGEVVDGALCWAYSHKKDKPAEEPVQKYEKKKLPRKRKGIWYEK